MTSNWTVTIVGGTISAVLASLILYLLLPQSLPIYATPSSPSAVPLPSVKEAIEPRGVLQVALSPLYESGSTIHLGPHLPKEAPKVFRFSGRVTLYNNRPCTTPQIEYAIKREYQVILPENKYLTILQAEPGKTPEVHVWLKQADCSKH